MRRTYLLSTTLFGVSAVFMSSACDEPRPGSRPVSQNELVAAAAVAGPPACCPIDEDGALKTDPSNQASLGIASTTQPATQPTPQIDQEPAPAGQPPTGSTARASDWVEPEDRQAFDLDYVMTDQDGRQLKLSDWVATPVALTFIFTRCPNPKMCPLMTAAMAGLEQRIESAGLTGQVKLALMSFDPVFDTPERLKRYGTDRGLRFKSSVMLRPEADSFRELLHEFQIGVTYNPDGSIGHFIELILIDAQGRFVRDYQGDIWDNDAVFDDLARLLAERE